MFSTHRNLRKEWTKEMRLKEAINDLMNNQAIIWITNYHKLLREIKCATLWHFFGKNSS